MSDDDAVEAVYARKRWRDAHEQPADLVAAARRMLDAWVAEVDADPAIADTELGQAVYAVSVALGRYERVRPWPPG